MRLSSTFPFTLRLLALLLALGTGVAQAQVTPTNLRLDASTRTLDLWPGVRVLPEPVGGLTPQQALLRAPEFITPATPHANLGPQSGAMWLNVSLDAAVEAGARWVFDVNYPSIDRIDLYQVADGAVVREVRMGDTLLLKARPIPGRSHAVELELKPGYRHELLMRVQTTSTMILPLTLSLPTQHYAREAGTEALQGMFAGIGICLLIYSLAHWLALRDRVFAYYAASVAGTTLFFLAYNGLAPEYLWPTSLWLTGNAAPLAVLLALWGGFLFLERILRVAELNQAVSWLMVALAWVAAGVAALFAMGVIDYRTAHLISTALGPLPMLLGLPMSWLRMRQGERTMRYLFAGWGLYSIGVVIMAGLLRGFAASNDLTQYAFQIGSTLEMAFWLVLLGQRVEEIRRRAEHDRREHAALRSLAMTDVLTGLLNRRGLAQTLAQVVQRIEPARLSAVFMIDLDGFKPVNDRHGHDIGDLLLVAVAVRLKASAPGADCIARLGGDEFVVVAEGLSDNAAAEKLGQKILDSFDAPFLLPDGKSCNVGATIGYALAPIDGRDPSTLLKRADTAMYEGKQQGKSCVRRLLPAIRLAASGGVKAVAIRPAARMHE